MLRLVLLFSLLFAALNASAQMFDEAEREQKQQEMGQQMLLVSEWLQDQGYVNSSFTFAVTALSIQILPPAEQVLRILNQSIDSGKLDKSDWHRLARFCQQAQLATKSTNWQAQRKSTADQFNSWCEKNRILKHYFKLDADNAYVYLFQMNLFATDPYNPQNLSLLRKAATAKYATKYFGFGLQGLTTHLREYYQTHQVKPLDLPAGLVFDDQDAFVSLYSAAVAVAVFVAYPSRVLGFCSDSRKQEHTGSNEKVVADCIRLMKLFRSEKNTLMEVTVANAIISVLSQPGSAEQLEAERQKRTISLTRECLSSWGDSVSSESYSGKDLKIFLKMQPLLESMGELQALAAASDQYFGVYQNEDEPKPSSCLLLKELDLEAARKMQSVRN